MCVFHKKCVHIRKIVTNWKKLINFRCKVIVFGYNNQKTYMGNDMAHNSGNQRINII